MAIMVIVTGCTNFGADMKAEKMKICKETFLTDNKVSEKAFLTVGQILEETYIIEVVMYHYGNIYVEYPKIHCLKDKEREKWHCILVKIVARGFQLSTRYAHSATRQDQKLG